MEILEGGQLLDSVSLVRQPFDTLIVAYPIKSIIDSNFYWISIWLQLHIRTQRQNKAKRAKAIKVFKLNDCDTDACIGDTKKVSKSPFCSFVVFYCIILQYCSTYTFTLRNHKNILTFIQNQTRQKNSMSAMVHKESWSRFLSLASKRQDFCNIDVSFVWKKAKRFLETTQTSVNVSQS